MFRGLFEELLNAKDKNFSWSSDPQWQGLQFFPMIFIDASLFAGAGVWK